MRILHFYRTYLPDTVGGIEQVIREIARGTVAAGHGAEVMALTRGDGPETVTVDNHLVHRGRLTFELANAGFSLGAFALFRRLAAQADVIHYHFPWPFMDLVHFLAGAGKPAVCTYHSDIVRQVWLARAYAPLMHRFLRAQQCIVATSPAYAATSRVLQRHARSVEVIPIGIDADAYPEPGSDALARWRERVGDGFFLFVGMLRYYKGLETLIDAVAGTELTVVIAGTGAQEAELKARARRRGAANVRFVGVVSDADRSVLLSLARGFVFPSHLRAEAFGVALVEAALFSKPMISCEIGTGTSHVNIDGVTGFVVAPRDPDALRAAMWRLCDDPQAAAAMGARAHERYRSHFTAQQMTERYLAAYRIAIERHALQSQAGPGAKSLK